MGNSIEITLLGFGLTIILVGAFYKFFLHDRKRSLLIPKYNSKKETLPKETFKLGKFAFELNINLQVWIGIVLILITTVVLLIVLIAPKQTSDLVGFKFIEFLFWINR